MAFKKGHIPWNKGKTNVYSEEALRKMSKARRGKTLSEEWRKKMSLNSDRYWKGKHLSEEHKRKISKAKKGSTSSRKYKPLSEETKRKISVANKGRRLSVEHKMKIGRASRNRSKETRIKLRKARLKQVLPTKDTSIEVLMQNELARRNIKFQKHLSLYDCQPDITIPSIMTIIHCDGDYWHNLPKTKRRDRAQDRRLRAEGWKVYRFWEHEIKSDVKTCLDRVSLGGG